MQSRPLEDNRLVKIVLGIGTSDMHTHVHVYWIVIFHSF
jgi:hypothetical protein